MSALLLSAQYALIRSARGALLDYCATLAPAHLLTPIPAFHNSSMHELMVHVARTYCYWLGKVGLARPQFLPYPPDVPDFPALRRLFADVDALVAEFVAHTPPDQWLIEQAYSQDDGKSFSSNPLQLLTHTFTHEFHHKGQVLSMSRLLGYIPIDTDVIRD